ncbi:MAG: hypothetical protein MJK14_16780 [Rivularia sp. ALOHA_DT_140]|nr:hypothetical protein [Rivularia sp. ALOHA_DT_140]
MLNYFDTPAPGVNTEVKKVSVVEKEVNVVYRDKVIDRELVDRKTVIDRDMVEVVDKRDDTNY